MQLAELLTAFILDPRTCWSIREWSRRQTVKEAAGHLGQQAPYLDDEGPVPAHSAVDRWIKARANEAWKEDWTGSKHSTALR